MSVVEEYLDKLAMKQFLEEVMENNPVGSSEYNMAKSDLEKLGFEEAERKFHDFKQQKKSEEDEQNAIKEAKKQAIDNVLKQI